MKYKKSFFVCMILLVILSAGVAFADENATIGEDTLESPAEEPILEDGNVASENQVKNLKELVEDKDYSVSIQNLTTTSISAVEVKDMPWDASGNISIAIDGKEKYNQKVQVSGNALILNDLNLAIDNHNVLITYSGDGKYAGFVKSGTISPNYEVECTETFSDYGYIAVGLSTSLEGNIKIVIDKKVVYNKANNGYVFIKLNKYSLGTHSYEVFYAGKSIRKGTFKHVNFDVYVDSDDFAGSDEYVDYGSTVRLGILVPKKATGFAKFKGKEYPFEFDGNLGESVKAHVDISGFDVGENIVEFHYQNQVVNYPVFVQPKVTVPEKLLTNESYKLTFNAPSNFNGNLILSGFMNGNYKVKNGFAEVPIKNLKVGEYTLNVKYEDYTWDYRITVSDKTQMIVIHPVETLGYRTYFVFTLPADAVKEPVVKVGDEIYDYEFIYEEDSLSYYRVDLYYFDTGNYDVVITYEGDDKYPATSKNDTLDVMAEIEGPSEEYYAYGSEFGVFLSLPEDAVGNLSVEIRYDGESEYKLFDTVPVNYGAASIDLPSNRLGKHSFNAYFQGNYKVKNCSGNFSVAPNISSLDIKYGDKAQITVPMDNLGDAKLVLSIKNNAEDAEGFPIAEFDLKNSNVVTIDKNIVYKARSLMKLKLEQAIYWEETPFINIYMSIYTKNAVFSDVEAIKVTFASKITGLANVNTQYSAGKTLTLKVYDIFGNLLKSGKVVKIKIGKKTFTAKTDKKGVVKFKIPNTVTPGKYTISATYKDFTVSKKITVKQILSVKTVKVKKSAKKLVLTATLKKVNGKYIKGKTVTFKFNGKTYKAKTSKKGVAKVTIKKSVLKKLKVGKKVKYQATYLKDTVKKSAKVKK